MHKMSAEEAKNYLSKFVLRKLRSTSNKRKVCSVEGCSARVVRMSQHLKQVQSRMNERKQFNNLTPFFLANPPSGNSLQMEED